MADQNQSPASQASVNLSALAYPLTIAGTPTWQALPPLSLTVIGGSFSISIGGAGGTTTNLLTPAALLGKNASVSTSGANGMWTLRDQLAAKRASAWP
jgi:hypothetical protein